MSNYTQPGQKTSIWLLLSATVTVAVVAVGALQFQLIKTSQAYLAEEITEQRVDALEQHLVAASEDALRREDGRSLNGVIERFGASEPAILEIIVRGTDQLPLTAWRAPQIGELAGTQKRVQHLFQDGEPFGSVAFRIDKKVIAKGLDKVLARGNTLQSSAVLGSLAALLLLLLGTLYRYIRMPLQEIAQLVEDPENQLTKLDTVHSDLAPITEHVTRTIALREKLDEVSLIARSNADSKKKFLKHLDRQIRTPLNSIMGVGELLESQESDSTRREHLQLLRSAADSLNNVVNNILDYNSIECGEMVLREEPFSLERLVSSPMESLAHKAEAKGLTFSCRIDTDVPAYLKGDRIRLQQVLSNVLTNAVTYTDTGAVTIHVKRGTPPVESSLEVIEFIVTDTGRQLSEEVMERLNEVFSNAHAQEPDILGIGIGFSLVRAILHRMRGTVAIERSPRGGTTVKVGVPLEAATEETKEIKENDLEAIAGMRVLVVDDQASAHSILFQILQGWQTQPTLTKDIHSALATVTSGVKHQIVLVDQSALPDQQNEALELLRALKNATSSPVVMLVHPDQVTNEHHSLGLYRIINKPMHQHELLATLFETCTQQSEQTLSPKSEAEKEAVAQKGPLKLLLAEDNRLNRTMLTAILESEGHLVTATENGAEAVKAFMREDFDLVLMDVQMPVMDGYEATKHIRLQEQFTATRVPILALTAHAMESDRQKCLRAGMDDYFRKPIRKRQLLHTVYDLTNAEDKVETNSTSDTEDPSYS